MKQKIVAMMVALAASLGAIETWEDPVTGYTWWYRIVGETVVISSDKLGESVAISPPPTGVLEIPSMLDGRTVSGIWMGAFAGCTNLTGVTIPLSVTSIDAAAFYWCSGLESVTIPPSVTNIGYNAFYGCSGLRRVVAPAALRRQIEERTVFKECRADLEIIYEQGLVNVSAALDDGKANVSFYVAGDVTEDCPDWNRPFLSVTATDIATGATYVAAPETLSGDTGTASGAHNVVWDFGAQGIELPGNVSFTVSYLVMPLYCVIDLSGGTNAENYAVTYLDAEPEGGFTNDLYKTEKLAMRLIAPGTFKMNGETETEITNAFYCAVFETTQKQWELVTGDNPSRFKDNADSPMRPVEQVSWNMIRGNAAIYDWPNTNAVDATSFLGVLRQKTGLAALDLPTEAQWEYACRAGTTTQYSYGDTANGDYMWYFGNSANQTHAVGTKQPNAWGLYDMHGNVWEWCLDLYRSSGSDRMRRGGGWSSDADYCTSSYRFNSIPSIEDYSYGFRLARTLSNNLEGERSAEAVAGAERAGVICSGSTPSYLAVGEYVKVRLEDLGYDVPTDGTAYTVTAYGLPAGLKLKFNAAVTKKVKKGKKTVTVVVKPAKCEWWIEGVPTAALDYATNPAYLVITVGGQAEPYDLPIEILAQNVTELGTFPVGTAWDAESPLYLPGVTNGWTVSGLPPGLKYTSKLVTTKKMKGKKVVSVTTNALPYSVYGKVKAAGLFTVTAKKKKGAYYETMKYRMLVTPKAPDAAVFGDDLTNITTMAYVPVEWDLTGGSRSVATESGSAGGLALPVVSNVVKVAGLPKGVAFAASTTYKDKNKKQVKQYGQTIVGTPTKPGTYVVTFTKNVTTGTGKNKKTVAKTAQILWKVVPNDAPLSLGFNTAGGVVEGGSVGLKYGDLLAFSATSNAKVTASGLPAGMKLVRVEGGEGGRLGEAALPGQAMWGFAGFTTKAGTYLVTVTATLNGKTVRQRLLLKVEGLPTWAKGTFNGAVSRTGCQPVQGGGAGQEENAQAARSTNGLATITVSSVGKISGKFYEGGTNWVLSAANYTDGRARSPSGPQSQADGSQISVDAGGSASRPYQEFTCSNVVAKYTYKAKEKVKGKWKTVTKSVTRTFALTVAPVPVVPDVSEVPVRGVAALVEAARSASGPYQGAEIDAWQNLWGTTYKAVGKKLFYTSKKKPYKTFAYGVYTNETGGVSFVKNGVAALPGLTCFATLSLKVTPSGAVTATLSYDTGKTKKDPKTKKTTKVIYKPTCATVVIPTTAADAYQFLSGAYLFFAPSATNNFPGVGGWVQVTDYDKVQLWEGGPYWATTNIGAERPEDYGLYFWWGDTTGYRPSSSGTFDFDFSYDNPAIYTFGTSMSELQEAGWMTSGGVLAPEHDAAHVHWGGSWRMPTDQEQQGLVDNCEWSPATMNGVDGYIVRGRGDYDSASIFLPCAGYSTSLSLWHAGSYGSCWSSVPYLGDSRYALSLNFRSGSHDTGKDFRYHGQPVRPVQGFTE